jgi:hypothetical protein
MPWVETEELFKSTLKAAVEVTSPHDGIPKDLKVVDLGEAGRQEVWQTGSKCIQKTIAKHGGKRASPLPLTLIQMVHVWDRSWISLLQHNDWTRVLCFASSKFRSSAALPHPCFSDVVPIRGARGSPMSQTLLDPGCQGLHAALSGQH